jgi:hypothetical protein
MSIRKLSAAALAVALVAPASFAQVTPATSLQQASATLMTAVPTQVSAQKALATSDAAQFKLDQASFQRGGGRPGPRPGPFGPRPGPRPGPFGPRPGPHGGDWGRWGVHGWGFGSRYNFVDGRWLWWGWAPFVITAGVACNAYYSSEYSSCQNSAWASNAACIQECGGIADCNAACNDETRNAVQSCQFSYDNIWSCGGAPLWPPVGVVIRIP